MKKTSQPNILLLVLDTHRAERMSVYGYHKDITPVLGKLAEESTVFDWGIAPAAWTIPSHASMFAGVYPTIHQTNQSYATMPDGLPTLAEMLSKSGYSTVGFVNNPLVGLLENGLKRGFDSFYNYSGTFPDTPAIGPNAPLLRKAHNLLTETLQKVSVPIERRFGELPLLLKLAMMPLFVPFWTRLGKFKGDTAELLGGVTEYMRYHHSTHPEKPLFMFVNMMETHLPYYPPRQALDKWVPYLKKDREARDFLQRFNTQSYRWVAPMIEPFNDMQYNVLSDVYDAEVAYQDHQLRKVFRYLKRSGQLENTMVVVVSDHGESHGEHDFMGHGFAIYNEEVRVPLMIHYPKLYPAGKRVEKEVSTCRVFHSILEAAGIEHEGFGRKSGDLSLTRAVEAKDPCDELVIPEAFPPQNFVNVMAMNNPEAIERFRVQKMRRTIYKNGRKLMTVDNRADEFFDVGADYHERNNLLDNPFGYENDVLEMEKQLEEFVLVSEAHRDGTAAGRHLDYSNNPELLERLRGLGYIE